MLQIDGFKNISVSWYNFEILAYFFITCILVKFMYPSYCKTNNVKLQRIMYAT